MNEGDRFGVDVVNELAGSLPFVGPIAAPAGRRFAQALHSEWSRNRSDVLQLACRQAGLSREDLAERLEQYPDLVPLVTRVLHQAGMTGADRPLRVLAGYLGDALADPTHADDATVILGSLDGLAEPHIRLLEMLAGPAYEGGPHRWHAKSMIAKSDYRAEVTSSAFSKLVSLGLVDDGSAIDRAFLSDPALPIISVSQLGHDLLAVLQAVQPLVD